MLETGSIAPEFTLPDSDGNPRSLSDFRGSYVIIYFYPKDNTPGCTTEACNFRDDHELITDLEGIVIGVSADSQASHIRFRDKFELPFLLLSDPEHEMIEAYGAWQLKKSFGKEYMGIVRSTVVIDKDGKVLKVFKKVSPKTHAEQIKKLLEAQK